MRYAIISLEEASRWNWMDQTIVWTLRRVDAIALAKRIGHCDVVDRLTGEFLLRA